MKKLYILLIALIAVNCSKKEHDKQTITISEITGKWRKIGPNDSRVKTFYWYFNSDYTFTQLIEDRWQFRDFGYGTFQIESNMLTFTGYNWGGSVYYTYEYNRLTFSDGLDNIFGIFTRDDSGPDREDWIGPIIPIKKKATSVSIKDLTFDGQYLWMTEGHSGSLPQKTDTINFDSCGFLPIGFSTRAIGWDGEYLWAGGSNSKPLCQIDPQTGNTVFESCSIEGNIEVIGYDGQYLWCYNSSGGHSILKYDPGANLFNQQISEFNTIQGITSANGYLFICMDGIINKFQINPFKCINAYAYEDKNYKIRSIAYAKNNTFWVSATKSNYKSSNVDYFIEKIGIPD